MITVRILKRSITTDNMELFRKYQKVLSKLTVAQIQSLTDEEIQDFSMERPEHPTQFGFIMAPEDFESDEQMAEIATALIRRLGEARSSSKNTHETVPTGTQQSNVPRITTL